MAKRIGIALFGLGRAGRIHFSNILRNVRVELKYIVEEDEVEAQTTIAEYRLRHTKVLSSKNYQKVLEDGDVKACMIATPTETHEEIVLACLNAHKAVFCEKPLANSVEAIERCYDRARELGLPLLCSFNRRFDPGLQNIHKRLRSGEVGQLQMVKTTSRDHPLPPLSYLRTSHGIYQDCAVHDIDTIAWLFGEKPATVYTTAHSFIPDIADMGDHDLLAIVLKFPSGGIGIIDISRFSVYGYDQRTEVFGSDGMLVQHNHKEHNVEYSGATGSSTARIQHSFPQRYAASYTNVLEHFIDAVQGKCDVSITKESTLLACHILSACEQSLKTKKAITME